MSGEDLEIRRRLALVERSVRRYRAALVVVGLIAAAGIVGPSLVGATKAPATVQAKRFQVVDDNGVVRRLWAPRATSRPCSFLTRPGRCARSWAPWATSPQT